MAVTYGFFDSRNGDRKYNADQMSEYFRGIVSGGVFQHLDGGLQVTAGTGLSVNVAAGRAIVQNRWIQNSASLPLSISAASETYGRKDAVVLRLDSSARTVSIAVKTGTPAASPAAPSMTRTGGVYEMALAYVNVAAGATSVTVTDKRSDSAVCGWAAVAQATSGEVDQMLNDMKTGFDGVVYPSPAAMVQGEDRNLQDQIDDINDDLDDIKEICGLDIVNTKEVYHTSTMDIASTAIDVNAGSGWKVTFRLDDSANDGFQYTLYVKFSGDQNYTSLGYVGVEGQDYVYYPAADIVSMGIYKNSLSTGTATITVKATNQNNIVADVDELKTKFDDLLVTPEQTTFLEKKYSDINLIDRSKLLPGKYIQADGTVGTTSNLFATDWIEIDENNSYYVFYVYSGYYAFYDENKTLIEGHGNDDSLYPTDPPRLLTIPTGTKYARFSVYTGRETQVWMSIRNSEPSNVELYDFSFGIGAYCEYTGNDMCVFSKGLCIGDSLTEGTYNYNEGGTTQYGTYKNGAVLHDYSYPAKLSQMLGIEITNLGIGGQTSAEWWALMSTTDFSGHDFAIIQFGVNDVSRYTTWGQTSEDAYNALISKLKTDNPGIKIYVATIIPSTVYVGANYTAFSQAIRNYVASKNDPDVILADIAQYGHTAESQAYNAGHLTAYGYWRLAQDYKNLIGCLIAIDKLKYRQVQFIGTSHSYTD